MDTHPKEHRLKWTSFMLRDDRQRSQRRAAKSRMVENEGRTCHASRMADRSGFNRYYEPTLGDMLRTGVRANVACTVCKCERAINLQNLIDKVGPDYSLYNRRCRCRLLPGRSEENTSELQSLMRISYAVLRLKKKNHKHN